jgi:4-coumarate--CoA ligase
VLIRVKTDFVILAHTIWWAGAILSPVNTSSTAKDVAHCIDVVKPTHIFTSAAFLGNVQSAINSSKLKESGKIPTVISVLDRIDGLKKARDFIF